MASSTPQTILAVDDNDAFRYSVARRLRDAGFQVIEAATGAEALRLAREEPVLITLDINLPDIDGFEVCRRLKSDPVTREIPGASLVRFVRRPRAQSAWAGGRG